MILVRMQCSLNKDHLHLKWQPQKWWTLRQDFQDVQDKQLRARRGVPKACQQQAAADSRGSWTCVCAKHPSCPVWHTQGGKDELTPWYRLVGVAVLPVSRKGGTTGLRARASGRHVVRGRQSSPVLEVRPGNRQGWWKLSTFRWEGRQLTLDKTVGSLVWWHTRGSSKRPALVLGWGSSSRDGSRVAIDWVTCRSYSSARRRLNVQSGLRKGGKVLRSPARA